MMIVPREKDLIRFYVQLAVGSTKASTLEDTKERAQRVLAPFKIEWEHIDWFSCYNIGQGIAERYSSGIQTRISRW